MIHFQSLILALSIFATPSAEESSTRAPWYVLIGVAGGYSRLETDLVPEIDKNGFQFNTDGVLSHYWDSVVGDIGFGWMYNETAGEAFPILNEEVRTYAPFFELNARYRLTENLSLGVSSHTIFGTDLSFGSEIEKHQAALLMGPQMTYDIGWSRWLVRLIAQAHTDLTIVDRQLYNVQAGIQFGFEPPKFDGDAAIETKETAQPLKNGIVEVEKDQVKLTLLAESSLFFDFAKSEPRSESMIFLERLAKTILQADKKWKSLSIEGHTDSRGPEAFNLTLSKARANAVRSAFIRYGLSADKLTTEGFAARHPRVPGNTREAHRQNRRVEFRFLGVDRPTELQRALQKVEGSTDQ